MLSASHLVAFIRLSVSTGFPRFGPLYVQKVTVTILEATRDEMLRLIKWGRNDEKILPALF